MIIIDIERALLIDATGTERQLSSLVHLRRYLHGEPSRPTGYTVERLPSGCSLVWPHAWWPSRK
jgi:hypothetical protein